MKKLNRKQRRMSWKRFNKLQSKSVQKPASLLSICIQMLVLILTLYSAKIGLSNMSPLQFMERWRTIIGKMTGNPYFATPSPSLADQTTMVDSLEVAIQEADSGDHDKIAHRNDVFDDAKDMFRLMVWYVTQVAQGDREIIRSAGLEERKGKGPSQVPGQVQGLNAIYFGVAKIKLTWNKVASKPHYVIEYTTDPVNGTWIEAEPGTFRTKFVVLNLTPGVEYYFRVSAENSLGRGDASEVANFRCG